MKTNISLELSDEQRNQLAQHLDGKDTKRLVTRKEVTTLAVDLVLGYIAAPPDSGADRELPDQSGGDRSDPPARETGKEAPRAVVEVSPDIPCENPTKEKDFPAMLADFYLRALNEDESLHNHIIWECKRRGVKVK